MSKLAAAGLSSTVAGPAPGPGGGERLAGEGVRPDDRRVQAVGGLLHVRGAGVAEPAPEVRPALADEHRGGGPLGDDRAAGPTGPRPCLARRR